MPEKIGRPGIPSNLDARGVYHDQSKDNNGATNNPLQEDGDRYSQEKLRGRLGVMNATELSSLGSVPLASLRKEISYKVGGIEEKVVPVESIKREIFFDIETGLKSCDFGPTVQSIDYQNQRWPIESREGQVQNLLDTMDLLRLHLPEGGEFDENDTLLGVIKTEITRNQATLRCLKAWLPYLIVYWDGMGAMDNISKRGLELSMQSIWTVYSSKLFEGDLDNPARNTTEIRKEFLGANEKGETPFVELARYSANMDHTFRMLSKMNLYNPVAGDVREIDPVYEDFLANLLQKIPAKLETGGEKLKDEERTQKITVYLDGKGNSLFASEAGTNDKSESFWINTLDAFNTLKTGRELRRLISTFCALAVSDAKSRINDIPVGTDVLNTPLFKEVKELSQKYYDNFDLGFRGRAGQKFNMAKIAYYFAYSQAFGTFEVGKWGASVGWKPVEKSINNSHGLKEIKWIPTYKEQGNPTASGDAYTAMNPFMHEFVYVMKNRISSGNNGVLDMINADRAKEVVDALSSRETRERQREKILKEIIENNKHQHLAKFFGLMGLYQDKLSQNGAWRNGRREMSEVWKEKVNPEVISFMEKKLIFIPTWVRNKEGENYYFPMIVPELEISLFDMLHVSDDTSVADLLEKTWVKKADGGWEQKPYDEGGKFLTLTDISSQFLEFHPDADDSRAVDNRFSKAVLQSFYGQFDGELMGSIKRDGVGPFIYSLIKAADLGTRGISDPDGKFQRPTREIVYSMYGTFLTLAMGIHQLLGRAAKSSYYSWKEIIPNNELGERAPNFHSTSHTLRNLVSDKLGYDKYGSSARSLFISLNSVVDAIYAESDEMATATAKDIEEKVHMTTTKPKL